MLARADRRVIGGPITASGSSRSAIFITSAPFLIASAISASTLATVCMAPKLTWTRF